MLTAYRRIFRVPGAAAFSAAAFVGRMPVPMAAIGIVAMLSQRQGGYWMAGAVAAAFSIANALMSPQISRLVDRFGQLRAAAPATAVSATAFLVMILASWQGWPVWTLFAAAIMAGSIPSASALVRARWSEQLRGKPELATAFAFESATGELTYVIGASLSVGLSVSLFPEAGMLATAILLVGGMTALLAQRATEPKVSPRTPDSPTGHAIALRPVQIVTVASLCVGITFATTEVAVVAITEALDRPGAATAVISVYALGSFVLGLIMGLVTLRLPQQRLLLIALAALWASSLPLLLADSSVTLLAVLVFLHGIAVSPTFITAFTLIERRVPPSMLTEGVTWVTTGISIGTAIGASLTGWVIDSQGPQHGFWVSVVASLIAVLAVALGQRALSRQAQPQVPDQAPQTTQMPPL